MSIKYMLKSNKYYQTVHIYKNIYSLYIFIYKQLYVYSFNYNEKKLLLSISNIL